MSSQGSVEVEDHQERHSSDMLISAFEKCESPAVKDNCANICAELR